MSGTTSALIAFEISDAERILEEGLHEAALLVAITDPGPDVSSCVVVFAKPLRFHGLSSSCGFGRTGWPRCAEDVRARRTHTLVSCT